MTNNLKPCPWCGHPLAIALCDEAPVYAAYCGNCGLEGPRESSVEKAIEAANNRPTAWRSCATEPPVSEPIRPILVRWTVDGGCIVLRMSCGTLHDCYEWCEVPE